MSQHHGPKGRNVTAKRRRRPNSKEIAQYIENRRKTATIRPIMGNILSPKTTEEAKE